MLFPSSFPPVDDIILCNAVHCIDFMMRRITYFFNNHAQKKKKKSHVEENLRPGPCELN